MCLKPARLRWDGDTLRLLFDWVQWTKPTFVKWTRLEYTKAVEEGVSKRYAVRPKDIYNELWDGCTIGGFAFELSADELRKLELDGMMPQTPEGYSESEAL
jgi:hypothetical protein